MKRFACLMISAAAMVAAGTAMAAGDAARGEAEFAVCAVCHGEQGEGFEKYGAPKIGGQEDWYIVLSLTNFRAGARARDNCDVADVAGTLERAKAESPDYAEIEAELATHFEGGLPSGGACSQPSADVHGSLMRAIALTLEDDQLVQDLAAYATSLTPPLPPVTVEGDVTAGTMGYATCIACHGANGEGIQALNAPAVAGQHDWYTQRQLMNYMSGVRGTNPQNITDMQMRPMAQVLITPEAVKNVTAYINTFTAAE